MRATASEAGDPSHLALASQQSATHVLRLQSRAQDAARTGSAGHDDTKAKRACGATCRSTELLGTTRSTGYKTVQGPPCTPTESRIGWSYHPKVSFVRGLPLESFFARRVRRSSLFGSRYGCQPGADGDGGRQAVACPLCRRGGCFEARRN